MKALLQTLRTRWVAIAIAVAAIAFVAGVSYGFRTTDDIVAQEPSPTYIPPSLLNTPTKAEAQVMIATAEAIIAKTGGGLVIRVIDPKTGKPVEETPVAAMSKEEAALQTAYDVAYAKYHKYRRSEFGHVQLQNFSSTTLTSNLQEYLSTDPDRAIYLRTIDRVIHLPENIRPWANGGPLPHPSCTSSTPDDWCKGWPSYVLRLNDSDESDYRKTSVTVDSTGTVDVRGSDTLPDGFSFLSEFKIVRRD